jgi:hypothetical protein
VDLHNGHARVTSQGIGHGCTFELTLPVVTRSLPFSLVTHSTKIVPVMEQDNDDKIIVPCDAVKRMILSSPVRLSTCNNNLLRKESFHGIHILVVDDSKLNRKFMIRILSSSIFIITEAEDGLECLEKYKANLNSPIGSRISVILMDVSTHSFILY